MAFWTRYGYFLVLSIKLTHDDFGEGPKWSNSIFLYNFWPKRISVGWRVIEETLVIPKGVLDEPIFYRILQKKWNI